MEPEEGEQSGTMSLILAHLLLLLPLLLRGGDVGEEVRGEVEVGEHQNLW